LGKDRDAIDVWRDFGGDCHASLLNRQSITVLCDS